MRKDNYILLSSFQKKALNGLLSAWVEILSPVDKKILSDGDMNRYKKLFKKSNGVTFDKAMSELADLKKKLSEKVYGGL
ncbi:MAG: hypothetical protein KDC73_10965 [Ignavibacteriae bacterium]|nr:hypothetical protein [Ignavibacteriota bacterium]MCB0725210.1 hypothetical protein [Ignavibacteriota bacterium]MCB9242466.1 hypothetical protein [Ignavibacteriales bacterium]